ncbi:MAG TPA: hypothetical protein PLZ52_10370 [Bacteroidales bacterium]|nr:hypothetical protein [Bacteroidales bacterium]
MKIEKRNLLFLKSLNRILFIACISLMTLQCLDNNSKNSFKKDKEEILSLSEERYNQLQLLMKDSFNVEIARFEYVLFFSNTGCLGCNERYFNVLNKNGFKDNVLVIFCGGKRDFDYNRIDRTKKNQIIDERLILRKLFFLQQPSILKVGEKKIDTVYNINASFDKFDSIMILLLSKDVVLNE